MECISLPSYQYGYKLSPHATMRVIVLHQLLYVSLTMHMHKPPMPETNNRALRPKTHHHPNHTTSMQPKTQHAAQKHISKHRIQVSTASQSRVGRCKKCIRTSSARLHAHSL